MPRTARLVLPDVAHHVIQRGNRQQRIFFTQGDCRRYIAMLAQACGEQEVGCLAWCLMPNHIHLALKPASAGGLRAVMSSVHTRYAQRINRSEGASGHLFQDRFRSYPMDDAHLLVAVRYIENNPVKAGLVTNAEDWRWSSARAHTDQAPDGLTDVRAVGQHIANWRAYLREGVEAADRDQAIEAALRSGRPLGTVPRATRDSPSPIATPPEPPSGGLAASPREPPASPG